MRSSGRRHLMGAMALAGCALAIVVPMALGAGVAAVAPNGDRSSPPAAVTPAAEGGTLFTAHCASCHEPAVARAPPRADLARLGTLEVLNVLLNGSMRPMAQGLTMAQLGRIATYVSPPTQAAAATPPPDPPRCGHIAPLVPRAGDWPAWGRDLANRRGQSEGGPTASVASRLKVKWAFALAGGKDGQPTIAGGRVFITSFGGNAY